MSSRIKQIWDNPVGKIATFVLILPIMMILINSSAITIFELGSYLGNYIRTIMNIGIC